MRVFNLNMKLAHFSLLVSACILVLFHLPFFIFTFNNLDCMSWDGLLLAVSLPILILALNGLLFYLAFFLSRWVGRFLLMVSFIINALSVYFIHTYGVIIDESMVGNVLNTNYDEASSFFSLGLIFYIILLGIVPSIYLIKIKTIKVSWKGFFVTTSLTLLCMVLFIFANARSWLWIDKHSKTLGALLMPWSYSVNTALHYAHKHQENEQEILLPDATIKDNEKSVMVLVIGESARKKNFSLYGYEKNTNPLLSKEKNVFHFDATSCATYTTAGVRCILEYADTDDLYEILPNYLYRNKVEVVWRTTNWGEPPVHIQHYQTRDTLMKNCKGEGCNYDEVLLTGLKEQILSSQKNKILIVLHTSTSHAPTYSKKYPPKYETFTPVCNSVELSNCTQTELINAYDNTIVYTDYMLHHVIETLKLLKGYKSAMLFVSDHGESLGEKNLYTHGLPLGLAPKEQYEIPFIVWVSDPSTQLKPYKTLSQNHVFHSVLKFLNIQSPIYNEEMNIFK